MSDIDPFRIFLSDHQLVKTKKYKMKISKISVSILVLSAICFLSSCAVRGHEGEHHHIYHHRSTDKDVIVR